MRVIKSEQPLVLERRDELDRKKWIASSPVVNRLCEREDALRLALKGVRNQLRYVPLGKRCKFDFVDASSRLANAFEFSSQWMSGIDLVIPIGADHQQVLHVWLRQEILEHFECGGVEPLQVVEKQHKWVFRSCEHAYQSPEYQLETLLRGLRRKLRNHRLSA